MKQKAHLTLIIILAVTLFSTTVYSYAQDDLDRDKSGVIYYDEELDPAEDERAEIEFVLKNEDGDYIGEENHVYFYIESSRDSDDIDLYYHEERNYQVDYQGDNIWRIETDDPDADFVDGRYISIWVETNDPGEVEFYIGKEKDNDQVVDMFMGSDYGGNVSIEVAELDAESYDLEISDDLVEAGEIYDLTATVREYEDGPRLRNMEVTFYQREEGESSWNELDTVETDRDGVAELSVETEKAGAYEYTAAVGDAERGYVKKSITVVAASDLDTITALDDEINITEGEQKIYFRIMDEYGNINKDYEHGLANFENFSRQTREEYDYTERIEITAYNPDGEETEYSGRDIEYCPDNEAMFADIDFDELGEWEVRGEISGTAMRDETYVNVTEFGEIEDIELELDNKVMRNFTAGDDSYNFEYYEEDKAKVYLIDEDGVRIEYDTTDDDIYFASSSTSTASINSSTGQITPRSTGETEIRARHAEKDLEDSKTLYLSGEPDEIEITKKIEPGELDGEVILTMLDSNGIRAIPGEFETYTEDDTEYPEEFVEDVEYEILDTDGLEILDKQDFEYGKASFQVEADDYGEYTVDLFTDFGLSKTFDIVFEELTPQKVIMTIDDKKAIVDGEEVSMDVSPTIVNDRTFLPFRIVGEILGVDVEWDGDKRAVEAEYEGTEVMLFIDEITAYIDDEPYELDGEPYIDEDSDRTMIPFRFFAEAFGADVEWDEDEEEITVEM
ncbi:stalk domain-containing protein [Natranaerofaba carboxydovora]|uniref:stalk domain-containing protein n=1 Tax=Natranaerofaba carboxydovora TaxID=2742683 RepID=UPI001F13AFD4|nr:stalk domain-containing protein [Natranaerofaba carboxydovora]UMZ74748.1 hypothetical protein ACONDI_02350 [Natranaerofaba carboxydovora]